MTNVYCDRPMVTLFYKKYHSCDVLSVYSTTASETREMNVSSFEW